MMSDNYLIKISINVYRAPFICSSLTNNYTNTLSRTPKFNESPHDYLQTFGERLIRIRTY
jgi:hypothetical protein